MPTRWIAALFASESRSVRLGVLSILTIAALLRIAALGTNPAGLFHDEAEKGYSAFCLSRVGGVLDFTRLTVDPESGGDIPALSHWPLFVNVWGSLTSMIYQYAALPFVAFGGLSVWTVRLPAALVGTLTVLLAYLLARRLTGRQDAALWAMALMAVSPWHVAFSRWAAQGIFVPLFIVLALLALFRMLRGSAPVRFAMLSGGCFGLAFYSHSGAQPFLLAFWAMMIVVLRRELAAHRDASLAGLAMLLLVVVPTLWVTLRDSGAGMGRFEALSVFGMEVSLPYRLALFIKNYLVHFSPQYLFISGDHLDRHGVRGFGEMLLVEMPFLVAGLYTAARRRTVHDRLLLGWFLLFPLSAALTREGIPHALRTLHAVPCPQILSAMGAVEIIGWARRKGAAWWPSAVRGLVGLNAAAFAVALFVYYPHYSAPLFEYGVRESVDVARAAGDEARAFDWRLYVPVRGGPPAVPELFFFFTKAAPEVLRSEGMAGAPVWFVAGPPAPSELGRLLRPGDSVMMSGGQFERGGIYAGQVFPPEIESHSIYWRPQPFSDERTEMYRVLWHR